MSTASDILKSLTPILGTVIAGPVGGVIAKEATDWIAGKLGIESKTIENITDAVIGLDPEKRIALEQEFARWHAEFSLRREVEYLRDIQDARKRDAEIQSSGKRNNRADIMFVLAVLIVAGVFTAIWQSPEINEYVKGVATLILGRFLGYLDGIYNFEFGSTRSSKEKDGTISNLSKG